MTAPFSSLAASSFTYLIDRGFLVEATGAHSVTFAKDAVRIVIERQATTGEISLRVARGNQLFSMSELIRASDAKAGAAYRDRIASTEAALEPALTDLAHLLLKYGRSILDGDDLLFPRLARQRRHWGIDLELRSKAPGILQRANEAFAAKDYSLAARLFAEVEPLLTEAQRAKLRIARDRGGPTSPA